ncbi:LysR family transcriptional regulator [Vibrio diabolicus]|uniref:LysR family transcriptional regulator n=1 Tax=Vibrio diabolicus TaxID=50719 RepID=UPI0021606279|nr:LysR family transcriptional regulator [Vibrio diabolicus]MCS0344069.1 LysR family transcriptional regulator [Vibrio diabolicus]MCS0388414.1 LysR family transcriptional regulator [Vibrio diabolicus]MCS0432740.1 LysR family transcriptional regulator [Vibrio diabolicus]
MFDNVDQIWLKSFHCVYENNSFKRAAECLNIPTSNVSRHIALLEEKLNIRLFNRTTRRMTPTEAGEELYSSTRPLLEQLNNALETVTRHSHTVTGELRILMPDTPVLAKAVVTFCTQYPSISLSCDTTLNPKDDVIDSFDVILSFHRGTLSDSNWVAREIKRWPSVILAAPQLLIKCGRPYKITDLNHVPCITTLTAVNGAPWVFKNPDGGHITQTVQSSFKVNSGHLAKSGALSGLGYAILPIASCKDEIESDKLEVIPLEYEPEDLVLYAFYSSRKHLAKKISMFVEHLKQHAKLNA